MANRVLFLLCVGPLYVGHGAVVLLAMRFTIPNDAAPYRTLVAVIAMTLSEPVTLLCLLRVLTRAHQRPALRYWRIWVVTALIVLSSLTGGVATMYLGLMTTTEAIVLAAALQIAALAAVFNVLTRPRYVVVPEGTF